MRALSDFHPTPQQKRFFQATVDEGFNAHVSGRARAAEVSVEAARGWMRETAFKLWLAREYERFMKEGVMRVWAAIFEKAVKKQDTKAAELFLERFDPDFSSRRRAEKPHKRAARIAIERLVALAREEKVEE